jgi:hypothetical protein
MNKSTMPPSKGRKVTMLRTGNVVPLMETLPPASTVAVYKIMM